jgi:hypothetical protein
MVLTHGSPMPVRDGARTMFMAKEYYMDSFVQSMPNDLPMG